MGAADALLQIRARDRLPVRPAQVDRRLHAPHAAAEQLITRPLMSWMSQRVGMRSRHALAAGSAPIVTTSAALRIASPRFAVSGRSWIEVVTTEWA